MTARQWVRRLTYGLLAGLVGWGFTAWVGLRPQPLLVILATVTCVTFGALVTHVHAGVETISWSAPRRSARPRYGLDPRFSRLSQDLSENRDPQVLAAQLHTTLVRVIDDRLSAHHGIDRTAHPEQAHAVLGTVLAAYAATPAARTSRRQLSDLLTRIEAL